MSDQRLAAGLFLAALLARTVSWMGLGLFGPDSANFLTMADWMGEGRFQDALAMAYHPLFPLLIAVVKPLAGGAVPAGHAVSIVLGAAATIPLFCIAREMFGRPSALLAGLIYALHPRMVDVQSDVMTEATFMFFFLSAMWLTWRMGEEPTADRGVVLALSASAAFLTRAEGILVILLAVAWPAAQAVRNRCADPARWGAVLLTPVVVVLALAPYLFWVKAERGHWAMSVRPSLISAERAVGIQLGPDDREDTVFGASKLYKNYAQSIIRLSLHGALIPFYILGLAQLRKAGLRRSLWYLAFTGGLLGGVLLTLRQHNAMSDRYLMVGMALLGAAAAAGMVSAQGILARKWPDARWRPALTLAAVILIVVAPAFRWLHVRRTEERSYVHAAAWFRSQEKRPSVISGTAQVAYLAGSRPILLPLTRDQALRQVRELGVECFVFDDRDAASLPEVSMLRSSDFLFPPVRIAGSPGTIPVYVQFVK